MQKLPGFTRTLRNNTHSGRATPGVPSRLNITSPEAASNTYTVQSGDNLSKIGKQYGVSWQDIFEANRHILKDPDKIYPGQELTIPQ